MIGIDSIKKLKLVDKVRKIIRIPSKIKYKETRYRLPAILYGLILITGYFFISLFYTPIGKSENLSSLKSTDYINAELPEAQLSGKELSGRREALENTYGAISDYSAIEGIEREGSLEAENYESKYTEEELLELDKKAQERTKDFERLLEDSKNKGEKIFDDDSPKSLSKEDGSKEKAHNLEELETSLARARLEGQKGLLGPKKEDVALDRDESLEPLESEEGQSKTLKNSSPSYKKDIGQTSTDKGPNIEEAKDVKKVLNPNSTYFNTIAKENEDPLLIKAIIDEDIKAVDGSRVRLRLLEPVEIDDTFLPKGTYLYATMSGFSSQRVKGVVESVMAGDEIFKVNLTIYDMDGLEGLYVPSSSFRETAKDVLSSTATSNMSLSSGTYDNNLTRWGISSAQNAYSKITNAISKSIKKNRAKLKYGSFIYLVNKNKSKK